MTKALTAAQPKRGPGRPRKDLIAPATAPVAFSLPSTQQQGNDVLLSLAGGEVANLSKSDVAAAVNALEAFLQVRPDPSRFDEYLQLTRGWKIAPGTELDRGVWNVWYREEVFEVYPPFAIKLATKRLRRAQWIPTIGEICDQCENVIEQLKARVSKWKRRQEAEEELAALKQKYGMLIGPVITDDDFEDAYLASRKLWDRGLYFLALDKAAARELKDLAEWHRNPDRVSIRIVGFTSYDRPHLSRPDFVLSHLEDEKKRPGGIIRNTP